MIKVNEANWDRIARIGLGVVLLVVGFTGIVPGVAGTVVGVIGFIPLLTGLIGWCPIYSLFGFSTCPVKQV